MNKGDPVEVLTHWAHGCEPAWFKGYVIDHAEPSGDVIVLHADGPFEGAPVRHKLSHVRPAR